MKKYFWLISGTTLGLFLIGLLLAPFVLRLTETIIGEEVIGRTTSAWLVPTVSLGLLLAFCSICAGCYLWVHIKNNFVYAPKSVFSLGLLVSLVTAVMSVGFKLLQIRFRLHDTGGEFGNLRIAMESINYFYWSFGFILAMNALLILGLLSFLRQR